MQTNQAGIDRREEIFPENEDQRHRQQAEKNKADGEQLSMFQRGLQNLLVAAAELLEPALESALEFSQKAPGLLGTVFVAAHDVHHQGWDQGPRQQVGRQHGEADGFGQRDEKELRDAGEKEHRYENDANAQRGYDGAQEIAVPALVSTLRSEEHTSELQ